MYYLIQTNRQENGRAKKENYFIYGRPRNGENMNGNIKNV